MSDASHLVNQAIALLERGELAAAFQIYDARIDHPDWVPWAVRDSVLRHRDRVLQPGDAVAGRDIVVFTEQGLGDNIMFARYLPLLAARGARVTLACPPALQPIFARIEGVHRVLSPPEDHPHGKLNLSALRFDAFVPLMSLPRIFGTTMATIPAGAPYLRIEPERIAAWQARYAAQGRPGRRRIGLVFQTTTEGRSAERRSLRVDEVAALAQPDIELVNLQPGPAGRELVAAVPAVIDAAAETLPLDEYSAAIAATDLLICADTMAAHCAGAMGHPVWVALPQQGDWRWGRGPTRSPWYPSAELFRQQVGGDWRGVVSAMRQRLAPPPPSAAVAASAAIDRGVAHHQRQELEAAIECYREALGYAPQSAQALCNLALALGGLRQHGEALAAFDASLALAPDMPLVRLNRAQLLLLLGRWEEGWREYEWRLRLPRRARAPVAPRWDGSPVGDRVLLLYSEQGLGDTIQMLRYLRLVTATVTGGRVLLAAPATFDRLLGGLLGIELVQTADRLPRIDLELPLCSLPMLFSTRPETIPPQPPELFAPSDSAAASRVRASPGPRIGVVWAGNPTHLNDATRSMPLAVLAPLIHRDGPPLFSLQKGQGEAQLETAGFGERLIPLGPLLTDMADTAAAIREMDLVISVCTSVAHLAATLGKPTWLMLPYASEWRWLLDRTDTPWYPTMRIFCQQRRGDWAGVVAEVIAALGRPVTPPR